MARQGLLKEKPKVVDGVVVPRVGAATKPVTATDGIAYGRGLPEWPEEIREVMGRLEKKGRSVGMAGLVETLDDLRELVFRAFLARDMKAKKVIWQANQVVVVLKNMVPVMKEAEASRLDEIEAKVREVVGEKDAEIAGLRKELEAARARYVVLPPVVGCEGGERADG